MISFPVSIGKISSLVINTLLIICIIFTAHVLEDLQITQQELIDVAAQTQSDKFQERSKIPISVKKVQVLLAEEIPPNAVEMPPPRLNIDKGKEQGTGSSGGGSKSKENNSS